MSFAHIALVSTDLPLPAPSRMVWVYDAQSQEKCYAGFTSTQELIAWINRDGSEVDCACIQGEWEIDDEGNTWDDFDAWELYAGDTWEGFKKDFREDRAEIDRDNRAWRDEIAREEGMLNGINSYNDWMGY